LPELHWRVSKTIGLTFATVQFGASIRAVAPSFSSCERRFLTSFRVAFPAQYITTHRVYHDATLSSEGDERCVSREYPCDVSPGPPIVRIDTPPGNRRASVLHPRFWMTGVALEQDRLVFSFFSGLFLYANFTGAFCLLRPLYLRCTRTFVPFDGEMSNSEIKSPRGWFSSPNVLGIHPPRLGTVIVLPHSLLNLVRFNSISAVLSVFVSGVVVFGNTWYENSSAISPSRRDSAIHLIVGW